MKEINATTQRNGTCRDNRNKFNNFFFATLYGPDTDSALPLLNLWDLLTVHNIYKLQLLNFTHQWHSKKLPNIFSQHFRYASEVHTYNTRYASKRNFYKPRFRTNIGKQTTSAMATELWQQLPTHIKNLSSYNFPKKIKRILVGRTINILKLFYFNHMAMHYGVYVLCIKPRLHVQTLL